MAVKTNIDMVAFITDGLSNGQGVKYKRISDAIGNLIHSGQIEAGRKLPPHRVLSEQLKVTVGTISRAYGELERLGLVASRVGDGTFVSKRGVDRRSIESFRNYNEEPQIFFDMSRNMYIPGSATNALKEGLEHIANNPNALRNIALYSPEVGLNRYREAGAEWIKNNDFEPSPDQVICVNGGQHGLICALMGLLRSGDTIATEHLTYPGLITAARMLGIKVVGIATDEEGLLPSSLDTTCRTNRITAVFCTPTIQTPTATVMSIERREAIAQVCREHNLIVIEDDAYGALMENRPPPLCVFAPERTILITSLSKTMPSGLRVGYMYAPHGLVNRLANSLLSTCWMATPIAFELVTTWMENGQAVKLRTQQSQEIRRRKKLVHHLIDGCEYIEHSDSPHFWISVPDPLRAAEIEAEMKLNNYLVSTAEKFAVGHAVAPQFIRASVCDTSVGDQTLINGFTILSQALNIYNKPYRL